MTVAAKAWKLYPGRPGQRGPSELVLDDIELPRPRGQEVLVEPLFGCWAGNIGHALERKPIDVCRQRREPWVVLGNVGVVRVLELGEAIDDLVPGQLMMLFCASVVDEFGYPILALGYDAPGTMGCMATRMIIRRHELIPVPADTRHPLPRWAAFSGASITAWSNWELAYGTLRLQLDVDELARPWVFGWGGGTTMVELDLARRFGCRTVQLSASAARRALIEAAGITALDRGAFPDLHFDAPRFAAELDYRRAYLASELAFERAVAGITEGAGVNVFIDFIGAPVHRATLKVLARQGVVTSAGWKLGMDLSFLRASECIARHQFVHTHYARYRQGLAAIAYAEAEGWLPPVDDEVWSFDTVPELVRHAAAGGGGFFHVFAINPT
ncbi:Zinc-binding dehydrogenase [Enhygromyxa salina]|uniref:Zinc-binding dehydrogenase n=1 Tax=Enhygromyxa salina TaxID=215803 RepID=A0A2S9YGM6_9BACT|nr:zinc-binding alcohol dehydrogenase family protein [Enhygromyxa salina]PRQ04166.1 Zinc-binding dehydrogenase [Enhygromyxa salina]